MTGQVPGGSEVKASAFNAGEPGSIPGSGKIPWRRKWQSTPVFLPGESHGWRSLVGYSPRVELKQGPRAITPPCVADGGQDVR